MSQVRSQRSRRSRRSRRALRDQRGEAVEVEVGLEQRRRSRSSRAIAGGGEAERRPGDQRLPARSAAHAQHGGPEAVVLEQAVEGGARPRRPVPPAERRRRRRPPATARRRRSPGLAPGRGGCGSRRPRSPAPGPATARPAGRSSTLSRLERRWSAAASRGRRPTPGGPSTPSGSSMRLARPSAAPAHTPTTAAPPTLDRGGQARRRGTSRGRPGWSSTRAAPPGRAGPARRPTAPSAPAPPARGAAGRGRRRWRRAASGRRRRRARRRRRRRRRLGSSAQRSRASESSASRSSRRQAAAATPRVGTPAAPLELGAGVAEQRGVAPEPVDDEAAARSGRRSSGSRATVP